eukprot:scaffold2790_cov239-Pinguiococcus_pyrenoidosus.AAC.5
MLWRRPDAERSAHRVSADADSNAFRCVLAGKRAGNQRDQLTPDTKIQHTCGRIQKEPLCRYTTAVNDPRVLCALRSAKAFDASLAPLSPSELEGLPFARR